MKPLLPLVLFCIVACAPENLAPPKTNLPLKIKKTSAKSKTFPQNWLGHWKGDCRSIGANSTQKFSPFKMELMIQPKKEKLWGWVIKYKGANLNQTRNYEVQELNAGKGHYVIDEKNRIKLDTFKVTDNLLLEQFQVGQSMLLVRHE